MKNIATYIKLVWDLFKRGAIGFIAGLIVAWFVLLFLGVLHGHTDLSLPALEQEYRGRWILFYIACGTAVFAMIGGKIRISKFWKYFIVVFGVIALIPAWPSKSGTLLPLGTPYVNWGFETSDLYLLAVHASIAFAIAFTIHWVTQSKKKK
jgi:hypothetical protein